MKTLEEKINNLMYHGNRDDVVDLLLDKGFSCKDIAKVFFKMGKIEEFEKRSSPLLFTDAIVDAGPEFREYFRSRLS